MENRAHALAAGLFTIVLGAALVAVAIWFGKDDARLVPYIVTTTTSVAGLKAEAPVRYRGVEVGKVESIVIDPGSKGRIHIRIGILESTPVTRTTYARLGYLGVTGLAFISLDDSGVSSELLRSDGNKLAQIELRPSILDTGEDLLSAVGEVAGRVKKLLNDDNQETLYRALAGLDLAARKTAAVVERLEANVAGVPALVGEARGAIGEVRGAVGEARGAAGKAGQLIGNLDGLAAKIGERVDALAQVAKSVEEVGATARAVNDESLPRFNALMEQLHKETRALDRLLNALGEQPQSIVFGTPPGRPGPGESGFSGARP